MSLPWVDLPADSMETRPDPASTRRRYSTTLGQGASLRSAPTGWPRKLSGEGIPAAADGIARVGRARHRTNRIGRVRRGIGSPPETVKIFLQSPRFRAWQTACFCY